ncbi:MAG TPA: glycosyltransferase family 39 protein [Gemmataceae bacterium]|nr:glycosyltransferase family 39 protein [Gemmataceae bacterium]
MNSHGCDVDFSARYRWMAFALIFAITLIRLLYIALWCPLDLAPDEAHYWDWSRDLDFGYYSKGPLVAWLIRASCASLGDTIFAVRLPAALCGGLLLFGLHALTREVYRSDRLALVVAAVAMTLPLIAAGASLMTIDAPFTCAWMWALVFAHRAIFRPTSWAWLGAGLCVMLGMLAKHTMLLFVPSLALFLATTPTARTMLWRRGFWIMTALAAIGGVPILIWNAVKNWPMLEHTSVHVGVDEEVRIRWFGPIAYVAGQFAILLGVWFIAWVGAIWRHRPTLEERPEQRFLWWMSAPTFIFFAAFSLLNGGGEPNWPIVGYLAGMVLAAGWVREQWHHAELSHRLLMRSSLAGAVLLGLLVIYVMHQPLEVQPILLRIAGPASEAEPMPLRRIDPTSRLRGWRHLAAEVDRLRNELRSRGVEPVLAGERWTHASELGFYCAGQPRCYCLGTLLGDRRSQFDLWRLNPVADPDAFAGRTFVVVGLELERLQFAFDRIEPARVIEYRENGELIAIWTITVGHGYHAAPAENEPSVPDREG